MMNYLLLKTDRLLLFPSYTAMFNSLNQDYTQKMETFLHKAIYILCFFFSVSLLKANTFSLTSEICYNGVDDNADGLIDAADPLCKTIEVTTTADVLDGDVSSVENLENNVGPDGAISLREAIAATQSPLSRNTFHIIGFKLLNYDANHFYYQEDNIPNQVTAANKMRTTSINGSAIDGADADYPRSWYQFPINSTLPPLADNVMIDGYDLSHTQMNEHAFGGTLNTALRIEIVPTGNFPIFIINEGQEIDNQVVIRGLSLNASQELIIINEGTKGKVWLNGNYLGIDPTALAANPIARDLITINQANRPIIIGSNQDGIMDEGEINLIAGVAFNHQAILLDNVVGVSISHNYFGLGLAGDNDLNGGEGKAILSQGGRNNRFMANNISFFDTAFDLVQSNGDTIQQNLIGVHSADLSNSVIGNYGGIIKRSDGLIITENTIANSQTGWRFIEITNTQFIENELYGHLAAGLSIMDEAIDGARKNEANFIYKNKIHDNLIGILIGLDATDNSLIQNSIYQHGSIGIDLSAAEVSADGVSENDLGDFDNGPQQLLNYPSLSITNYTVVSATVSVDLDINDSFEDQRGYRIEFFANSSMTDRGGEIYIGYLDVEGDVTMEEVTLSLPEMVTSDYYISATTSVIKLPAFTEVVPSLAFGETSEFSASVALPTAEICDNNMDDDGDGLVDCEDPDCGNYSTAGQIAGEEATCASFDPVIIDNVESPLVDDRETIFYQWQKNTTDNEDWLDIIGAERMIYDPTTITQTTRYRRLTKKHLCNDWLPSNVVEKRIKPLPVAEIFTRPIGDNLCSNTPYLFEAQDAGVGSKYTWNFGAFANLDTISQKKEQTVSFLVPTEETINNTFIELQVEQEGCTQTATINYSIHPILETINVSATQPTSCGGTDGSISITAAGALDACLAMSIDGGTTYLPDNQLMVDGLGVGGYDLYLKYCADGCPINAGLITLSDPAAIQAVNDTVSGFCPGVLFKGNVAANDTLGANPVYSLAADGTHGRVTMEANGIFTYTPITAACGLDQFSYKVCDGNTGCCATAIVDVNFGDNEPPTFVDLPVDITIGIDDEIPAAASVLALDNCPAVDLDFEEESTQEKSGCGEYDYQLIRTWTATDQCGNATSHVQTISVVDETAPDIFRVHTLPNGKKMVAGVMEFTSQHWKTIHLPFNFSDNPIVFTQLVTTNEATTATIQLRNVTQNQFEIKLKEAEIDDSVHIQESVAWMAMEAGTQTEDYQFQADTIPVTHSWATVSFFKSFASIPLFFANMQTTRDSDAATLRNNGVNWNNGKVRIQEENSVDPNLAHSTETVGYLVIDHAGNLTNQEGETIGETGRKKVTNEWVTINLENIYNNPVVIANSLSIDDFDPATVRVQNVTATSFDIRVEEWSYLDTLHRAESISYLVFDGSLPLERPSNYCGVNNNNIPDFSDELIALDNTGEFLEVGYEERVGFTGTEQLIHRDWVASDICGNKGVATQTIACPGIAMQTKAILQGAMIGNNDTLMRDDLRKANLIPLVEPYTDLPTFQHIGAGGGEALNQDLLLVEGPDAIVDWVFLELRSILNKNFVVATAVGLVQRDGDIISNKGDSVIVFPSATANDYYVSIRHRNHICMISKLPYELSEDSVPMIDFTDGETVGIDAGIAMNETTLQLWAGDLNQDNAVIFQGPNTDIFYLFLAVLSDAKNTKFIDNFVSKTYSSGDVNLDGKVIYQGPSNDQSLLLFNTTLVHPENTAFFSNFILQILEKRD